MKTLPPPRSFGMTQTQYNGYCYCKKRLRIGDEVYIYIDWINGGYRPVGRISDHIAPAYVIGINIDTKEQMIGHNGLQFISWSTTGREFTNYKLLPNWRDYAFGYFLRDHDVKIARIMRSK